MTDDQSYSLTPIGVVRSPFRTRDDVPVEGGPAEVLIQPQYEDALEGIERSSHVFVIGFLHEADRTVLKARPRKLAADVPPSGVFACRSPARPNPLSLTVCRLLERSGNALRVAPLDLRDGTPVVDIKPYSPGWDDVFCARHVRRIPPSSLDDDQLLASLTHALENHVGERAETDAARLGLASVFVAVRHFGIDPRDARLCVGINRLDGTTDAVVGLLGTSFASGRLRIAFDDGPLFLGFVAEGKGLALCPRPGLAGRLPEKPGCWAAEVFETQASAGVDLNGWLESRLPVSPRALEEEQ